VATNLTGKLASTISKVNKIYLQQAPDTNTFAVLDGNACDGDGALFELRILRPAIPSGRGPWPNLVAARR